MHVHFFAATLLGLPDADVAHGAEEEAGRRVQAGQGSRSPLSAQRPEPTSLAGLEAAKSAETGQPATKPVRMKSFKVKETKFGCISKFFRLLAAWTMRMNNTIFLAS